MSDEPRRAFALQLGIVAVLLIALLGAAAVVLRSDDGEAAVSADATTTTSTASSTTAEPSASTTPPGPLTTLDFGAPASTAPPATDAETPTTPATTTTAPPPSSTTTTTEPLGPRRQADPGRTIRTESGAHGPMSVALTDARQRWRLDGPMQGYVYRTQLVCFCPRMDNEIDVDAAGTVVGQTTVDGSPERSPMSIDELFDQIEAAIRDDAASIEAAFDRELGYPVSFSIDGDERIADDEVFREIDWVAERRPPPTTTTAPSSTTGSTSTTTTTAP